MPTNTLRAVFQKTADDWDLVVLDGSIDENADLRAVFSKLNGNTVLNMQNVARVNSMGVHRWIPIVANFSEHHQLVIEEISYALVQNANVVANLFGSATVRSCMAPYYCGSCKHNATVAVTAEEVARAGGGAPAKQCPRCSSVMEFDELDGYFTFFKLHRR